VGETFSLFGGHIVGRHIELWPNKRIVQAWRVVDWEIQAFTRLRSSNSRSNVPGTKIVFGHAGVHGCTELCDLVELLGVSECFVDTLSAGFENGLLMNGFRRTRNLSSIFAQTSVEPKTRPLNVMGTLVITCRRVGVFASAVGFFPSLIVALPDRYVQPSPHESTVLKYVRDNIFLEKEILLELLLGEYSPRLLVSIVVL